MFEDIWLRLALLGVLFVLSAFFSGSETALMALDKLRVKYLVKKKKKHAERLERMLDQPDRLLGAILVGNNLVNIAASVFATGLFVHLYGERGELLTILVLTPILLIFAEICPKTYSARNPERVSFWVLRPILAVMWLLAPVIWVVTRVSRLLTQWMQGDDKPSPILSEDEIRNIISVGEEAGVLPKENRRMLHGIFDLSAIRARDIMIPRTEVVAIEANTSFDEALLLAQEARHSRFPVYEGSLDQVVGIIHSKDILRFVGCTDEFSLRESCRPPYFVPESKRVGTLLQAFRKKRVHLAIVVDEHGGMEGIVTLEDIVEEIVGEIQDEYDAEEVEIRELGPRRYLVDGSASLRILNRRFHLQLSEEHANTLAGFLMHKLGVIPEKGAVWESDGLVFTVRRVVERRIEEIEMVLPEEEPHT
ncbi:putative hemolysin [Geoalkalibacter ferrihydriticus]|uniref:Transporter n=2 Tax=Geoalkalibacter ferrihydriticus TaxID=392333 RepID=A0A0C2HYW1_9BACT|nr:CNNM domain-containing protein [Geoalkalibacter ferrihydriticus]KIH77942.1 transporter [Geoalkalibacter ferrihydriticus DSM 17813]SDM36165.1 putative hemolysin [Geoalkalibacter ferrihydriticus]